MIELNLYTARWDVNRLKPGAAIPEVGDKVRVHRSPDGREWNNMRWWLARSGRALEWSDVDDSDGDWEIWTVVAAIGDDDARAE